MIGLCEFCAYKQSDCKGNKDLEKLKCEYYKKRPVQNVKQMAERVAELEIKLKDSVEVVRCKDCRHAYYADNRVPHEKTWVCERFMNEEITSNDFCSWGERRNNDNDRDTAEA